MVDIIDPARRSFLKIGAAATGLVIMKPSILLAAPRAPKMKELAFHNLHTGERLRVTYWKNGQFERPALSKISHILRDFRTGETYPISANLIDLLHEIQMKMNTDSTIEIISGYRSPKTNAMLAKQSDGVAKQSYHTKGLATDIRMDGVSLRKIQTTAMFMRRGGVGYYPSSDFVHVDVGPVRRWG